MAIKRISNTWNEAMDEPVVTYLMDTDNDLEQLPDSAPSSTAISAESGRVYIVNASGEWVEFGGYGSA